MAVYQMNVNNNNNATATGQHQIVIELKNSFQYIALLIKINRTSAGTHPTVTVDFASSLYASPCSL